MSWEGDLESDTDAFALAGRASGTRAEPSL